MPTYPSTLPDNLQITGYNEQLQDQVLRSKMDAGPPKQRRRYSAAANNIQGYIVVDRTQLSTWKSFWDDDLSGGALAFSWQHPITEATASVRCTDPYRVKPHNNSSIYFQIHLKLEILP